MTEERAPSLSEMIAAIPPVTRDESGRIIYLGISADESQSSQIEAITKALKEVSARLDAIGAGPAYDRLPDLAPPPPPTGEEIPEAFEDLAEPDELPADLRARLLEQFIALGHRFADDSGMLAPLNKDEKIYFWDIIDRNYRAGEWLGKLKPPKAD